MTRTTIRRAWLLIQEPRSITITMALGAYLPGVLLGAAWLLSGHPEPGVRDWVALLLVVGGIIGILAVLPGEWALERVGIIAMTSGWAAHLSLTMADPRLTDRWDETAVLCLICCLIVRFLRTWGVPRDPERGKR